MTFICRHHMIWPPGTTTVPERRQCQRAHLSTACSPMDGPLSDLTPRRLEVVGDEEVLEISSKRLCLFGFVFWFVARKGKEGFKSKADFIKNKK